ncbi:MAG: glycoside hydrolase family 9 protein [Lachnospiraceae bacterium]|nr:glycoside hydrolase family 9 protein [Lachnospiraceae bacterium]
MSRRLSLILAGAAVIMILASGCGKKRPEPEPLVPAPDYDTGITVSNNVPEINTVITTGAGIYESAGSKRAMVVDPDGDEAFRVMNADTDKAVYEGKIRYRRDEDDINGETDGKNIAVCDLTEVKKEGKYYIKTDKGARSEPFTITGGLYKELLSKRLDYFAGNKEADKVTEENMGQSFMRIADRLLSNEFFPDAADISLDDERKQVPKTVLIAKDDIDVLKEFFDEDEISPSFLHSDVGRQYQYAAVFAMFAYNYSEYDKAFADECTKIAQAVYDVAEDNYEKGMYSATKPCDDKRFWASAQLYKLTGIKEYRLTAESYAGSNPNGLQKGLNEEASGYFGSVAYLTCYYSIELDVAEIFITTLMNDINTVVKQSPEEEFFTVSDSENEEEAVKEAFDNARLVVLGNYISKSITYVECCEDRLAFLYGRNALGKDYAYDHGSEYYNEPQEFILSGLIDSYIYEDKEPTANDAKQKKKTGRGR